jgi:hypothetical protein
MFDVVHTVDVEMKSGSVFQDLPNVIPVCVIVDTKDLFLFQSIGNNNKHYRLFNMIDQVDKLMKTTVFDFVCLFDGV